MEAEEVREEEEKAGVLRRRRAGAERRRSCRGNKVKAEPPSELPLFVHAAPKALFSKNGIPSLHRARQALRRRSSTSGSPPVSPPDPLAAIRAPRWSSTAEGGRRLSAVGSDLIQRASSPRTASPLRAADRRARPVSDLFFYFPAEHCAGPFYSVPPSVR